MNKLIVTNNTDKDKAAEGLISVDQVRSVEVDALVDTGAMTLALPEEVIEKVGAPVTKEGTASDAFGGKHVVRWAGSLYVELLGRHMTCDALVLPRGTMPLIGQIVLERLDLVVDPKNQEARVNPDHPDTLMVDMLAVA